MLMPFLQLIDGRVVPVDEDNYTIGSDSACNLVLQAEGVAPRHVILQNDGAHWRAATLNLRVETAINGHPLEGLPEMVEGDEIQLGSTSIRWLDVAPAPAAGLPYYVPAAILAVLCIGAVALWVLFGPRTELPQPAPPLPRPVEVYPPQILQGNVQISAPTYRLKAQSLIRRLDSDPAKPPVYRITVPAQLDEGKSIMVPPLYYIRQLPSPEEDPPPADPQ